MVGGLLARAAGTRIALAGVFAALSSCVALAALFVAPAALAAGMAEWGSPFVLQAGTDISTQYGYSPEYSRNVPVFDSANLGYIRSRSVAGGPSSTVEALVDGRWAELDFRAALRAAYPDFVATYGAGGRRTDGIVFDRQDRAYNPLTIILANGDLRNVLMVSWDKCRSWKVFTLPDGDFVVERWVGHNEIDGPPFMAIWRKNSLPLAGFLSRWRNDLWVVKPRLEGEELVIPEPVFVTDDFLGYGTRYSGGASFAVTHGDSTWFVWPSASRSLAEGVRQCVTRYDNVTRTVDAPVVFAKTLPADDPHNVPGICIDSQGYLHVVGGTHGTATPYRRSLEPLTSAGGWSATEWAITSGYVKSLDPLREEGRQTYVSFVCDASDTLHLVTRQERRGVDPWFAGSTHMALVHQSKAAGGPWTAANIVVVPPFAGYTDFGHKLALDHRGRLFLSCSVAGGADYWRALALDAGMLVLGRAQPWRGHHPRRMLFVSEDGGRSWRFATAEDVAGAPVLPAPAARSAGRSAALPLGSALGWLSPTPHGNQLAAVDFVDGAVGWTVGTNGTLRRTRDGGITWTAQAVPTHGFLFGVAAVSRTTAWVVGESGLILKTTDGGATWSQQTSGVGSWLFGVSAVSPREAWAVGSRGVALATYDGGETWRRLPTRTTSDLFAVDFIDATQGWCVGDKGSVLFTANGGRSWRRQAVPSRWRFHGVSFSSPSRGVAVGSEGVVFRTGNGGVTWRRAPSGVATQLNSVRMASTTLVFATGADGVLLRSRNGGAWWRKSELPVGTPALPMMGGLDADARGRVLVVGAAGVVCRSLDGGGTWLRTSRGLTASLRSVAQAGSELWVGGERGLLARREGASWQWQSLGVPGAVEGLAFRASEGWAVGQSGLVARSADGGASWSLLDTHISADLNDVQLAEDGRAWVAGAEGTLITVREGGADVQIYAAAAEDLHSVALVGADRVWVGGGLPWGERRPFVLRTEDGGTTWQRAEIPARGRVLDVAFVDADSGWAVVEDWGADGDSAAGSVYSTSDGGRSWVRMLTVPSVLTTIAMNGSGHGYVFGASGAALETADGWRNWSSIASDTDSLLQDCSLPLLGQSSNGGLMGWIVGDDGAVLELTAPSP